MSKENNYSIIYAEAPFIQDMGVLTTLCLLNDEVILIGSKQLDEHLNEYWEQSNSKGDGTSPTVVEQTFQVLFPEGVVSFLSPSDVAIRFPESNDIELPGIEDVEIREAEGKPCLVVKADLQNLNYLSRLVLRGITKQPRTLSSLIRETSIVAAAITSVLPIICEHEYIALTPSTTRVPEVSNFLAHRTLRKLALPELRAYHAEDILEARLKLKTELQEFRACILELVWLLHQRSDLSGDLKGLIHDCDVLIETKITAAISLLELAISRHKSKKVQRILKATGGALMELGKSLVSPYITSALLGGSGALMKLSESMDTHPPSIYIASFVYKVREKQF